MTKEQQEETISQMMKILPDVEESKIREFFNNVVLPVHKEVIAEYNEQILEPWVAMKHPYSKRGEYVACSKEHFDRTGYVPDNKKTGFKIEIEGLEQVESHTYRAKKGKNILKCFKKAGIEVLQDPIWGFDKRYVLPSNRV